MLQAHWEHFRRKRLSGTARVWCLASSSSARRTHSAMDAWHHERRLQHSITKMQRKGLAGREQRSAPGLDSAPCQTLLLMVRTRRRLLTSPAGSTLLLTVFELLCWEPYKWIQHCFVLWCRVSNCVCPVLVYSEPPQWIYIARLKCQLRLFFPLLFS